jgi:type I restriction enzyme S subunit
MKWESVRFEEIYDEPSRNGVYKSNEHHGEGVKIVNMGELFGHGVIAGQEMKRLKMSESEMARSSLKEGDLLFGRRSLVEEGAGKCSLVEGLTEPTTFESSIIRVRLNKAKVMPKFYYYWFKSHAGRGAIRAIVSGVNVKGIRGSDLRNIEVPKVPLDQQKSIADALSTYDDLIENNRRRMSLLEESARLLYREWFVHLRFPGHEHVPVKDGVPRGWEVVRLNEITSKIGSGATPKGGEAAYKQEGITLIRSLNVYDYRFDESGLAFIDEKQASKLANVIVESNDILLNITGASVGRCCMVQERHLPARVNQHVMIIRTANEKLGPHFLLHSINSYRNKERLLSIARGGGATREALTKDDVGNFTILRPPANLWKEFESLARTVNLQLQKLSAQNSALTRARDILLPRLMNGEIAV